MFFPFSSMSLDYFRDLGSSLPPYDLVLCSLCPHPTPINAKSLLISWKEQTLCLQLIAPGMGLAGLTGFAVVVCSDWLVFVPFLVSCFEYCPGLFSSGSPIALQELGSAIPAFWAPLPRLGLPIVGRKLFCVFWGAGVLSLGALRSYIHLLPPHPTTPRSDMTIMLREHSLPMGPLCWTQATGSKLASQTEWGWEEHHKSSCGKQKGQMILIHLHNSLGLKAQPEMASWLREDASLILALSFESMGNRD